MLLGKIQYLFFSIFSCKSGKLYFIGNLHINFSSKKAIDVMEMSFNGILKSALPSNTRAQGSVVHVKVYGNVLLGFYRI